MAVEHKVQEGEGISSIAFKYGFFADTLWNLPENAQLKELRKESEILLPGDVVHVPDKREKIENVPTGDKHKFKLKNIPARFNLHLLEDDEPRADIPYKIDVDGKVVSGKTDKEGWIRIFVPPDARKGKLSLNDGKETYDLNFGYNDPVGTVTGIQSRLRNLGFYKGEVDGRLESVAEALKIFQRDQKLEQTGEVDAPTIKALEATHGS